MILKKWHDLTKDGQELESREINVIADFHCQTLVADSVIAKLDDN